VGTSMCWGFITEKANLTDRLISYPHVLDPLKKNYTFGGAATAGAVIQWFRNNFGTLELETQNRLGVSAYSLLELQSQDVPAGSDGLVFLPYMMGERSPIWDSSARGTLMGLSLYHGKGHIYRACMEGVAYALRHNMESILGTSVKLDPEMVLVGGAAKSSLWTSIFADVSGYPVKVLQEDVEAPLGDALLAGLGTGVFDRPEILKEWLHFKEPVYPVTEHTEVYNELYSEYKAVYLGLRDSMKRLYSEGREE
ncbi:FGGY-family carbohydrate kinase, partial [Aminobacterium sp. UBA4834]